VGLEKLTPRWNQNKDGDGL